MLLAVLIGTPLGAVVCGLECAPPAAVAGGRLASTPAVVGCHEGPARSAGQAQLGRGDRDACRDHALPEDTTAAVLTSPGGAVQPPGLAVVFSAHALAASAAAPSPATA